MPLESPSTISYENQEDQALRSYQLIQGPGLELLFYKTFFSKQQSLHFFERLNEEIEWKQDKLLMYGKEIKEPRLTAWYGDPNITYTYSGKKMMTLPWTATQSFLLGKIEDLTGKTFNSLLLNYYRDGLDYMGYHSDKEPELGKDPLIVSLSLGASRQFHLQHRNDKKLKLQLVLDSGSLLIMRGKTQYYWRHAIPKTTKHLGPRMNLTFRYIIPNLQ